MGEKLSPNRFALAGVKEGFARGDGGEDSLFFWLFISDLGVQWKVRKKGRKQEGRKKRGKQEWTKANTRPPLGNLVDPLLRLSCTASCGRAARWVGSSPGSQNFCIKNYQTKPVYKEKYKNI
jgi:hypothetical protein